MCSLLDLGLTLLALQSRLQPLAASDPKRQQLAKESLELSQQAYHLQTLAEKLNLGQATASETTSPRSGSHKTPTASFSTAGKELGSTTDCTAVVVAPKTKYFVTSYTREETTTSPVPFVTKFHELKEQSAQVGAALAAKYKLQQKVYLLDSFSVLYTVEVSDIFSCLLITPTGLRKVPAQADASRDQARETQLLHVTPTRQ